MDDAPLSRDKVQQACDLLFGKGIMNADELRAKTNPVVLKAVFRRRAREVHPDRAEVLQLSPIELHERFTAVQSAFKTIDRAQKIEFQAKSYLITTELFWWLAAPGLGLLALAAVFARPLFQRAASAEGPRAKAQVTG